jgi:hypothetical protein
MDIQRRRKWAIVVLLLAFFLLSSLVSAAKASRELPLIVQTIGNQEFADPGTTGFSHSADISVVITTHSGSPVTDLGPSVIGNGSSVISLPTEWTFEGNFTRPPDACALLPNQFFNIGNGLYLIRVVSHPVDCPWVAGDYHYVVQIDRPATQSSPRLRGSGLRVLSIR